MPPDPTTKVTLGFAFVEFLTPEVGLLQLWMQVQTWHACLEFGKTSE